MKRLVNILIFCAVFVFGAAFVFIPLTKDQNCNAASISFKDVAPDYWGQSFISFASGVGIIKGYPSADGNFLFKPENPVTCEEAMQMIYQAVKNSGIGPSPSKPLSSLYEKLFADKTISPWAYECVAYGLEYGILCEEELAGFCTASEASREQVARWAAKALDMPYMPATSLPYTDKDKINKEDRIYVDLLMRMSIMVGDNSNRFNPKNSIKRVEFAVICTRIYELADKPLNIASKSQSLRGNIMSIGFIENRVYLSTAEGKAKVIDLENGAEIVYNGLTAYNGLKGIEIGKDAVIAWGPFGQVHVTTKTFLGKGRVKEVKAPAKDYSEIALLIEDGTVVYYFADRETSILNEPVAGQDVLFISDGVKILEIR